jgi:multisubunit Na+/H+ antiporter MnhE subunit
MEKPSMSTDFILGAIVGAALLFLGQTLLRSTSGITRWLPLLFFIVGSVACLALVFWFN